MRVGETSRRNWLPPIQKPLPWDDAGLWQNLAIAADTLESGRGLPKEIVRNVVECLVGRRINIGGY